MFLRCALLLIVSLATFAPAGDIDYGDFAGDTVSFTMVAESSTDPLPLFGQPTVDGDTLAFDARGFASESNDGALQFLDGRLTMKIVADPGTMIDSITLSEFGAFFGFGTQSASQITGVVFAETSDGIFDASLSFGHNGDGFGAWSETASVSFPPTTMVELVIDNSLFTSAAALGVAFIDKKGVRISVNDSVAPPKQVLWDNGDPDFVSAQMSQMLTPVTAEVADDFMIKDGMYAKIDTISLVMAISASTPDPDVCLRLLSDCDGKPDAVLYEFIEPAFELLPAEPSLPGFTIWRVTFAVNKLIPGPQRLWISPLGRDVGAYFWITSGQGLVQGRQGQIKNPTSGIFDWTDGELVTNFELCSDFNFCIAGKCCMLVLDNGPFDPNGMDSIDFPGTQAWGARAVDNFQISPKGDVDLCRVEAYVATNCDPERSFAEIYRNDCDRPSGDPIVRLIEPEIENVGSTAGMTIYRLRWDCPDVSLEAGQNYWLAAGVESPGNINDRAIFLFKQESTCHINISQGQYLNPFQGFPDFTPVDHPDLNGAPRDFAFKIYAAPVKVIRREAATSK